MLTLTAIAGAPGPAQLRPIAQLGDAHALTKSDVRMLTKFFGLQSVAMTAASHPQMCVDALGRLVADQPALREKTGRIIYTKTQTHNTAPDQNWLRNAADATGLSSWEVTTLSMNHCAGALSALHLLAQTGETDPVIILAGEKCFHASTANQSGAALGEMPMAVLLDQGGAWSVAKTRVTHAPAYYANPDQMDPQMLRQFAQDFGGMLKDFVTETLQSFDLKAEDVDLIVPYNLNLPTLREIAIDHDWQDRMILQTAPHIGHLFCADVFANLALAMPQTSARTVLCFAAGMGATFAATLLSKGTGSEISTSSIVFEGENGPIDLHLPLNATKDAAA
jgi:3-oxoacyl-[acyl-carrier-protein] synthase III